jgi:peptidoglycan/xylan/chitin deacetylase (PgdA/CDA1 family)
MMMNKINFIITIALLSCAGKSSDNSIGEIKSQTEKDVVCFVYHRFGDDRYPSTNISINEFEQHLRYLTENNFQVLTLSDAIGYLSSNEPARKTAVITIDDGYKSFYENGLPLLKKYKLPATLFINTSTVSGGDYMNWDQLKETTNNNIEIGNHTHTHDYFLNEAKNTRYKTFEAEIKLSQQIISEKLKLTPKIFAYPYGEFDREMEEIIKQLSFIGAAAQNSGVLYELSDRFAIPRFPMSEAFGAIKNFAEKAATKPLRTDSQTSENIIPANDSRPELTLTFQKRNLQIDRLQCFVQGSKCDMNISEKDSVVSVSIRSKDKLTKRRRTLYTITVPDKTGSWHWYSHLWINPAIK